MPTTEKCSQCKGSGKVEALVSAHDDRKETINCPSCRGNGKIHRMTDEEERDYRADYW